MCTLLENKFWHPLSLFLFCLFILYVQLCPYTVLPLGTIMEFKREESYKSKGKACWQVDTKIPATDEQNHPALWLLSCLLEIHSPH